MKYVLIILLFGGWGSPAATTAIFDDEASCTRASLEIKRVWSGIEKKTFCLPQGEQQ